jgi:hypothetical protein
MLCVCPLSTSFLLLLFLLLPACFVCEGTPPAAGLIDGVPGPLSLPLPQTLQLEVSANGFGEQAYQVSSGQCHAQIGVGGAFRVILDSQENKNQLTEVIYPDEACLSPPRALHLYDLLPHETAENTFYIARSAYSLDFDRVGSTELGQGQGQHFPRHAALLSERLLRVHRSQEGGTDDDQPGPRDSGDRVLKVERALAAAANHVKEARNLRQEQDAAAALPSRVDLKAGAGNSSEEVVVWVTSTADQPAGPGVACSPSATSPPPGESNCTLRAAVEFCLTNHNATSSSPDTLCSVHLPPGEELQLDPALGAIAIRGVSARLSLVGHGSSIVMMSSLEASRLLSIAGSVSADVMIYFSMSDLSVEGFDAGSTAGDVGGAITMEGLAGASFLNVMFSNNNGYRGGAVYVTQAPRSVLTTVPSLITTLPIREEECLWTTPVTIYTS